MTDTGLLVKLIMGLLIVVVAVTAFTFTLDDLQDKYGFTVSEEFEQSYNYSDVLIQDIENLRIDLSGASPFEVLGDLSNTVLAAFQLPVHAIVYLTQILSSSLQYMGLPEATAGIIGGLLAAAISIVVLIAFAVTIMYLLRGNR